MHVVMYKIIAYLYDCMKRGQDPLEREYSAEALGISQRYWDGIVEQLVRHRFVSGIDATRLANGRVVIRIKVPPAVTMEGVEFAQENGAMGRAKAFLQDAKTAIPFV